ncbi:allophanate hydrolase [Hydrogenophaga sp.]|uniref:allophanate hydrolase n=1 Tax=Hydrogenophaga sp. TaxID=1904254 RepID=UPI002724CF4B|nr:allophanate hydrolase [Hydrogenophaga sp.]MDO8903838.1 allophanate hydrolase [Hydrogenophaga sp.]
MVQETNSPETLRCPPARRAPQAWIHKPDISLAGAGQGPLVGLRFAVKDNIDVAGWPTTAACPAFVYTPAAHAKSVQLLLGAGASLVGKTNLDQFACGLSGTRSPYGAVPNAINPLYVSGGSSSGSAYAVATGQVDFALGTDTAGSGRVPAGLNNIVGLKPSRGLISARGVVPAAQSVDCVSIFTTTVARAAQVLAVVMAHDPADPYSRTLPMASVPFGQRFRFGVPDTLSFFGDAAASTAFDQAVQQLQAMGGEAVPIDYTPLAECADMLYGSALVSARYAAVRDFVDAQEGSLIEPVRGILTSGRDHSAADLFAAQTRLAGLAQLAAQMWKGIDLLVVPTAPTHYTIEAMQADPVVLNRNLGAYTNFVNLLDYAALSVPSSLRADGLPFGITLIGRCGSDWQLAELGQRFHHATGLAQGATGVPLPPMQVIPGMQTEPEPSVRVAVVGAHLSGMPLNGQLTERGATLVARTQTAALYRLYVLPDTTPPKPGLLRVAPGDGEAIEVEVWDMPIEQYGSFVALVPSPLSIGTLQLADGSSVQGFLCEPMALQGATDITPLGGWRAYIASIAPQQLAFP